MKRIDITNFILAGLIIMSLAAGMIVGSMIQRVSNEIPPNPQTVEDSTGNLYIGGQIYKLGKVKGRQEILEQLKTECELLQDPDTLDMYYDCPGDFTDY